MIAGDGLSITDSVIGCPDCVMWGDLWTIVFLMAIVYILVRLLMIWVAKKFLTLPLENFKIKVKKAIEEHNVRPR